MEPQPRPVTPAAPPTIVGDRPPKPEPIDSEVLLLVEGKDSCNFFKHLWKEHLKLPDQLQMRSFSNVSELKEVLIGLPSASGFGNVKVMGIIGDAEQSSARAFQSVKESLKHAKLPVPVNPEQLSCGGQPAVGIMILPGQDQPGMLETLLCKIFADTPERYCIDAFFKYVKKQCPDSSVSNLDKARTRVFLVTKPKLCASVGVAAQKGYWDLDHEVLEPAHKFLQSLMEPQPQPITPAVPPNIDLPPKPQPITSEVLLLVEGKDSLNFFDALWKHLKLSDQLKIMNFGGVKQLKKFLIGLPSASGFGDVKVMGIIQDAEQSSIRTFQSVSANLERAKLPVPTKPEQLSCDGQPAVGIMILPGQDQPGMLETLLCKIFADTPERYCIDAFFRCVQEKCPDSSVSNPDKACARAFLATKPKSYCSVGVAANEGYWNLDHEVLEPARKFLQSLAAAAD